MYTLVLRRAIHNHKSKEAVNIVLSRMLVEMNFKPAPHEIREFMCGYPGWKFVCFDQGNKI